MNSNVNMTLRITLSRSSDSYTETYEIRETRMVTSPVMKEEMCVAAFLGCVVCSKVVVITAINPFTSGYSNEVPYSDESMFVPVYCTPCANKSLGFCENARISKAMIMSTDVYDRVCCHTKLDDDLRIHTVEGMFVIIKASEFRHQIMDGDFVTLLDEDSPMQLKMCRNMNFFADVKPFFGREMTPESSDYE